MTSIAPRLAAVAVFLIALAACGGTSNPAPQLDVGVTSNSILLGTTNALSGPAAGYGTIANAENAYFTYLNNNQGGINGRKITFKILDDVYNSANTVPLTKQLVEQDQVFLMFSGLGTQTQTSVRDYLNGKKVPQLFVATGATTFNKDFSSNPWTLGWQPPYQGESRIYAKDITTNHSSAKIGVFYQNDDYGLDYLKGLTDGLGSSSSLIVDKEIYDVTAASPAAQLTKLKASGADTLFLFTTPSFTVKSLVTITKLGWAPTIYLNSVSNPQAYMIAAKNAGAALTTVTSVGYLKDPTDPQWTSDAGMQLYKQVIANCSTCNVNDGFNIYGVAVAYTMADVLKQAGSTLTRSNVMSIAALTNVTSVGYLKDPTDPQWTSDAGMQLYKQVIPNCSTCNVNDGFNIYGVAVAYTMADVLKQAGSTLTRSNVMSIAANQLNETNPFLLPGVKAKTTSSDHFPIMQEQVIKWNGAGWTLQGSLIDERGTIK